MWKLWQFAVRSRNDPVVPRTRKDPVTKGTYQGSSWGTKRPVKIGGHHLPTCSDENGPKKICCCDFAINDHYNSLHDLKNWRFEF
jgi:hypothetical protein